MPRWSEVEKDPRYLALTDESEKQKVRQKFYNKYVVPRFNELGTSEEERQKVIHKIFKGKFKQSPFEKAKNKAVSIVEQKAAPQIDSPRPPGAMPYSDPQQSVSPPLPVLNRFPSEAAQTIEAYREPRNMVLEQAPQFPTLHKLNEMMDINRLLEKGRSVIGSLFYAPQKYLLERPLSRAATSGRGETYEDWLKEVGHSERSANIWAGLTRLFTSSAFWRIQDKVFGGNTIEKAFGDKEAVKIKEAVNNGDYKTVAEAIKTHPESVRRVFGGKSIAKVMVELKAQDPEAYNQFFSALQEMTSAPSPSPTQTPSSGAGVPMEQASSLVPVSPSGKMQAFFTGGKGAVPPVTPPPSTPTSPPTPPPEKPTIPDIDQQYEKIKDAWIGEEDVQKVKSGIETNKLQEAIRGTTGEKKYRSLSKDVDKAIDIYIDLKRDPSHLEKYYDKLTPEQKRIVDLSQNFTPEQKAIADEISRQYDEIGQKAKGEGLIKGTLKDYVSRSWDIPPPSRSTEKFRKFGLKTRHAKARTFGTILEGWANKYNLKVEGATTNLDIHKDEINKVIGDRRLIGELSRLRDIDGNPIITEKQLPGYERVKHPNFKRWKWSGSIKTDVILEDMMKISEHTSKTETTIGAEGKEELKPITTMKKIVSDALQARGFSSGEVDNIMGRLEGGSSGDKTKVIKEVKEKLIQLDKQVKEVKYEPTGAKNMFINEKGDIFTRNEIYAPKHIAKNLNNMMGTSALQGIAPIDKITKYNAIIKNWILQSTFFHHQAGARSYYFGSSPMKAGETFFDSMKKITPRQAYRTGLDSIKNFSPEVELLVRNGLTIGKMQDWEENILRGEDTIFGRMLDKYGATKAIKDKINALREEHADFLFKKFMPGVKMQAGLIELKRLLKHNPDTDPNELAKHVANLMNDDFGGLHLKRMGRNPTVQHLFRIFALAPDWTESNIRTMVKAFKMGDEGKVYRDFWKRVIAKIALWTVTANILLHGKDTPQMYKKAWKAGGKRDTKSGTLYRRLSSLKWAQVDITPIYKLLGGKSSARKYFNLGGHFLDPTKFTLEPLRSMRYKGSVVTGIGYEGWTGKDWAGRSFTDLETLFKKGKIKEWKFGGSVSVNWATFPSYAIEQIKGSQPVQIQNLIDYTMGQMEGFDAILNSLGVNISTTYPKKRK